jgi:hypothetical protein
MAWNLSEASLWIKPVTTPTETEHLQDLERLLQQPQLLLRQQRHLLLQLRGTSEALSQQELPEVDKSRSHSAPQLLS